MLTVLLCAQIAASAVPSASFSQPSPPVGESRAVIAAQLTSPPRSGRSAGVGAEEADAITARYLASIGKMLSDDRSKIVR